MTIPDPLLVEIDARLATHRGDDTRRLFHGRGRCFAGLEGLTVDWFPPVALITLYDEAAEPWVAPLVAHLAARIEELSCAVVQRRHLRGAPSEVLRGELPAKPRAREGDLAFRLRLDAGQNVGYFGDIAPGRALVRRLARGRVVLNLFAYTCSFSVAAIAGGAARVVNVDTSRSALALGRANHRDHGHDPRRVSFLRHDVFKSFGKLRRLGPFGLIVADPPTRQGRSFRADRDWPKLLRRIPELAAPGARLIAALNSPHHDVAFFAGLLDEHLPGADWSRIEAADDHPDASEDGGLKLFDVRLA